MADKESDDSWEVRAFEEDTNHAMGTTWPPRSYTCSFCAREFRSAQALGGHMNVHRRDKARFHQAPGSITASTTSIIMNSTQHERLLANGGLCLYSLPNPNAVFSPTFVSPYNTTNYIPTSCSTTSSINKFVVPSIKFSVRQYSNNIEHSAASTVKDNFISEDYKKGYAGICEGEIDLELRLGYGSSNS